MACLVTAACNLSPLNNRIKVGEEPIVVFVGEGTDGNTDLFVAPASGGSIAQLTFTPLRESMPRINPRGDAVAFLRARDSIATRPNEVVLMNLLNGAERRLSLPPDVGRVTRIAWGADSNTLYARGATAIWRITTPPGPSDAVLAHGNDAVAADTAFEIMLGTPPFAKIVPCPAGGVCAAGRNVAMTVLSAAGRDPLHWGVDSVAWFEGDGLVIRGIGPGAVRRMLWKHPPAQPRDGSYSGVTDTGR